MKLTRQKNACQPYRVKEELGDSLKSMKVLDIFCGAGGLTDGFKKAGFEVKGADIIRPP